MESLSLKKSLSFVSASLVHGEGSYEDLRRRPQSPRAVRRSPEGYAGAILLAMSVLPGLVAATYTVPRALEVGDTFEVVSQEGLPAPYPTTGTGPTGDSLGCERKG